MPPRTFRDATETPISVKIKIVNGSAVRLYNSMLYFLCIDGHIYTVTVYADGKMPQDAMDYFDGLLLEACHTVVDLYQ